MYTEAQEGSKMYTKYELEQRLQNVQEQQQKLAIEAARINKFLKQIREEERIAFDRKVEQIERDEMSARNNTKTG
ncbi:MAG: hypothetical protein LC650_05965 [Actinobacteria bacterium]|nr:hypothetical protein [Actinomycetota bacterium]